jgi:hypothetical protein
MVHSEHRFLALHSQFLLEFVRIKFLFSSCNISDSHNPYSERYVIVFHNSTTSDTCSKLTAGALKRMLVLQSIMFGTSTFLANYPLLTSLLFYEVNAGSFIKKSINKIYNIHDENRLFESNLQQVKPLRKQFSLTVC